MSGQAFLQASEHPAAQPSYILRGHAAQIHAVHFLRANTRLLTGDAKGWTVLWSVSSKRAVVVWKPHTTSILEVGSWDEDKIITHGRDHNLHVWQLREDDEPAYSHVLPIDSNADSPAHKPPWLLHTLAVNALNFCSFSSIRAPREGTHNLPTEGIFLGTPGLQDGSINITHLPTEDRIATIPQPARIENAGMIMAIGLVFSPASNETSRDEGKRDLRVLAGYESGHACVWVQPHPSSTVNDRKMWRCAYSVKSHAQPILSLDFALHSGVFFTSGADAIVARHPLTAESTATSSPDTRTLQSRHAGQQGLRVRDDEKLFATAGWDGKMRVYSTTAMKELAVLKWHKQGCYAVAFAPVLKRAEAGSAVVEGKEMVQQKQMTVAERRAEKAKTTHWVAAGSKDGKVSLWDIY